MEERTGGEEAQVRVIRCREVEGRGTSRKYRKLCQVERLTLKKKWLKGEMRMKGRLRGKLSSTLH